MGQNVTAAYYDQEMRHLNPEHHLDEVWQVETWKTVWVTCGPIWGAFCLVAMRCFKRLNVERGRNRVALAKLMLSTANLLVLDELPITSIFRPARGSNSASDVSRHAAHRLARPLFSRSHYLASALPA